MHSFDHTLDRKPLVRRAEVITELGRRRRWSADAKAEIMLEALAPGAVVSEVARRHDVRPQQLFGWLRDARQSPEAPTTFVPVVIERVVEAPPVAATPKKRRKRSAQGGIEVDIDGVTVRIERGAETRTVAAVIQALKAGR
ncbi:MAG: transposase [Caulobacteraceae bacterium]|nr:transposase [Caulobacteraceae bacterium]